MHYTVIGIESYLLCLAVLGSSGADQSLTNCLKFSQLHTYEALP